MSFKTYILIILSCALCGFLLFFNMKQTPDLKDFSIITVGISPDYHPFAFIDKKTNEIAGFDVDVASEIILRMGKKPVVKRMPFKSLIFGLLAGDIDIIAAGITPTKQREKAISFSQSYFENDPLVALHNKNIPLDSLEDLMKYSIVVNMGYTADIFLSQNPNFRLTKLGNPTEAIMALQSGSVDVYVCAKSSLHKMLTIKSLQDFKQFVIPQTNDSYALAINKKNQQLKTEIDVILTAMKKDGSLKQLEQKWNLV